MDALVVKVTEDKNKPPAILEVGVDKDIFNLGLPNTARIGPGLVPKMYLLLRGAHYDLVVPRESILNKYSVPRVDENDEGDKQITETVTISRDEMENLQDMLLQTGQENEKLNHKVKELTDQINQVRTEQMEETNTDEDNARMKKRLIENNNRMWTMEKENIELFNQAEYLKAQNEQAAKHLLELDQQYTESKKCFENKIQLQENEINALKTDINKYTVPKPTPLATTHTNPITGDIDETIASPAQQDTQEEESRKTHGEEGVDNQVQELQGRS